MERIADDKMILERDVGKATKFDEPSGEVEIGLAGRRITGRMIVGDHERVCAPLQRLFEYVTGEGRSKVMCATCQPDGFADRAALGIEQEDKQLLLLVPRREDGLEHLVVRFIDNAKPGVTRREERNPAEL